MNLDKPQVNSVPFNDLAVELCETVHSDSDANIANSQISIDVPIYPEYEGRNYDTWLIEVLANLLYSNKPSQD